MRSAVVPGCDIVPSPLLPDVMQAPPVFATQRFLPPLRSIHAGLLPVARYAIGRVAVENEVVELKPLPPVSACGEGFVLANMASGTTSGASRVQTRSIWHCMTATAALSGQVPSRTSDIG